MTKTQKLMSTLLLFVGVASPKRCSSQGTVVFSNFGAPGAITNALTAQRAEVGTTFSVALYFAQDGVSDQGQLVQIGSAIHINVARGIFSGGTYTAPTLEPGGFGMFQVRVWETSFGPTFEQAVANAAPQSGRLALAGESGILRVHTGDPTGLPSPPACLACAPAVVGAPLSDGFLLNVVPEPGATLLLLLGLPFVLLRRGRF